MIESNDNKKTKIYACSNCGLMGHNYNKCKEPVTSWGIILIKLLNNTDIKKNSATDITKFNNDTGIVIDNINCLELMCNYMESVRFLLIRRKHSLGYIEFIRGRYMKDNINGIIYLFQQMTPDEINKIENSSFDELWEEFWAGDSKKQSMNKKEFFESKEKFNSLKNTQDVELGLDFYIKNVKPFYVDPEWGFPKGRKMRGESDLECAIREFCEETGYNDTDIKIVTNVKPIIENIIGTNGISYRHIYYIAEEISNKMPSIIGNNEVGKIGFFTYDDAIRLFREYHIEKKNITKNIFMYYVESLLNNSKKKSDNLWPDNDDIF